MSVTNPIDQEEFFRNIKITTDGRLLVDTSGGGGGGGGPVANYYVLEQIFNFSNLVNFDSNGNNIKINREVTGLPTNSYQSYTTGAIFRNSSTEVIHLGLSSTGGTNSIYRSIDAGVTFTGVGAATSYPCYHINYNGTIYLAIGGTDASSYAYNSVDGITWTTNALPALSLRSSAYSSSQWICIGYNGSNFPFIFTSPDGIIWTSRTQPWGANRKIYSIAYSDALNRFVISGYAGSNGDPFAYSTTGITWTTSSCATSLIANVSSMIWDPINELFIAAGYTDSTNYISLAYSADGITWTKGTGFTTTLVGSTSHHFKIYVDTQNSKIVAYNDYNMFETSDGIAWTQINNKYIGYNSDGSKEAFAYVPMV